MQKILLALFLISSSAILFVPMVTQAAACANPTCGGPTTAAEVVAPGCACGATLITQAGLYCYAAYSGGAGAAFTSQATCQAAISGGTGGTTGGPLEKCTMTRDVGVTGCPATGDCVFATTPKCGICCLLQTLYNITDWIFIILVGLAGIFVIMGAVVILTAGGTPEKLTTGRNYILYAAIGLLIAFLAKAIPGVVKLLAGIQ